MNTKNYSFNFLFWCFCWGAFAGSAQGLDFKPLSIDVQKNDIYVIRGYKGAIRIVGQNSKGPLKVSMKQSQPKTGSSDMNSILENEWMFSVQRRGDQIEILVRSPQVKSSWEKTMRSKVYPDYELRIQGPSRPLEVALAEGDVTLDNWTAGGRIFVEKGQVRMSQIQGDYKVGLQEGQMSVKSLKGDLSLESYKGKLSLQGTEGTLRVNNFAGSTDVTGHKGPVDIKGFEGLFKGQNLNGRVEFNVEKSRLQLTGLNGELRGKAEQGSVTASLQGEVDVRVTTKEGSVSLSVAGSGASVNLATEEGQISSPSYLPVQRLSDTRAVRGRLKGSGSGQIYVRSQSGSIRLR